MKQENENIITKLQWACRRGMLELDVLLGNFLNEVYPQLTAEDQRRFVQLLNYADPELFAWIMGHESAPDPDMAIITERIRQHAQSRICT